MLMDIRAQLPLEVVMSDSLAIHKACSRTGLDALRAFLGNPQEIQDHLKSLSN